MEESEGTENKLPKRFEVSRVPQQSTATPESPSVESDSDVAPDLAAGDHTSETEIEVVVVQSDVDSKPSSNGSLRTPKSKENGLLDLFYDALCYSYSIPLLKTCNCSLFTATDLLECDTMFC